MAHTLNYGLYMRVYHRRHAALARLRVRMPSSARRCCSLTPLRHDTMCVCVCVFVCVCVYDIIIYHTLYKCIYIAHNYFDHYIVHVLARRQHCDVCQL